METPAMPPVTPLVKGGHGRAGQRAQAGPASGGDTPARALGTLFADTDDAAPGDVAALARAGSTRLTMEVTASGAEVLTFDHDDGPGSSGILGGAALDGAGGGGGGGVGGDMWAERRTSHIASDNGSRPGSAGTGTSRARSHGAGAGDDASALSGYRGGGSASAHSGSQAGPLSTTSGAGIGSPYPAGFDPHLRRRSGTMGIGAMEAAIADANAVAAGGTSASASSASGAHGGSHRKRDASGDTDASNDGGMFGGIASSSGTGDRRPKRRGRARNDYDDDDDDDDDDDADGVAGAGLMVGHGRGRPHTSPVQRRRGGMAVARPTTADTADSRASRGSFVHLKADSTSSRSVGRMRPRTTPAGGRRKPQRGSGPGFSRAGYPLHWSRRDIGDKAMNFKKFPARLRTNTFFSSTPLLLQSPTSLNRRSHLHARRSTNLDELFEAYLKPPPSPQGSSFFEVPPEPMSLQETHMLRPGTADLLRRSQSVAAGTSRGPLDHPRVQVRETQQIMSMKGPRCVVKEIRSRRFQRMVMAGRPKPVPVHQRAADIDVVLWRPTGRKRLIPQMPAFAATEGPETIM